MLPLLYRPSIYGTFQSNRCERWIVVAFKKEREKQLATKRIFLDTFPCRLQSYLKCIEIVTRHFIQIYLTWYKTLKHMNNYYNDQSQEMKHFAIKEFRRKFERYTIFRNSRLLMFNYVYCLLSITIFKLCTSRPT